MKKIEKQIRDYVESVKSDPIYKRHAVDWCFGAINFCCTAGLISDDLSDALLDEFGLLDDCPD